MHRSGEGEENCEENKPASGHRSETFPTFLGLRERKVNPRGPEQSAFAMRDGGRT
jgi:hypothetical protein